MKATKTKARPKKTSPKKKATPRKRSLTLKVIGVFEHREVAERVNSKGEIEYIAPVSGTHRAAIDVETPRGEIFRLQVDPWVIEQLVREMGSMQLNFSSRITRDH